MIDVITVSTLLSSKLVVDVFRTILKTRSVQYKDIRKVLSETDAEPIKDALNSLKKSDLIKEDTSSITDFSTYYVTADGLEAEQKFDRLLKGVSSNTVSTSNAIFR